jgi:acyl-CoA thioesterase-1
MFNFSAPSNPLFAPLRACFAVAMLLPLVLNSALAEGSPAPPFRLLAFGDSLIHGYGLAAGETLPERLEAALRAQGHSVEVVNGGNSGDTTASGRARLDWALGGGRIDLALVAFGGNDALRGLDPAVTYDNLDAILVRLEAAGLPVLLAGMLAPRNLGADYAADFDAVFPRLAKSHGVAFYPFLLDGVALDPALNQADGIHPNPAGVEVIVEHLAPRLGAMIEALAERRAHTSGKAADSEASGGEASGG